MDPYPRVAFSPQGLVPWTVLQDHLEDSTPSLTPSGWSQPRDVDMGVVSATLGSAGTYLIWGGAGTPLHLSLLSTRPKGHQIALGTSMLDPFLGRLIV